MNIGEPLRRDAVCSMSMACPSAACPSARGSRLSAVGPAILLTATSVGAGDILTGSLAGAEAGTAVLWAVPARIILKWTLTEGIARWQMATGTTLLEGWITRFGRWILYQARAVVMLPAGVNLPVEATSSAPGDQDLPVRKKARGVQPAGSRHAVSGCEGCRTGIVKFCAGPNKLAAAGLFS